MKTCRKCGETKAPKKFHRDSTRRDGRAVKCKLCNQKVINRSNKKRRNAWRVWLVESFDYRCSCCSYNKCGFAIEVHHIGAKAFTISTFMSEKTLNEQNIEIVLTELKTCAFLCSNCHRELHAGMEVKYENISIRRRDD